MSNSPYYIGDTVTVDGIECLIVYDAGSEQSWGRYLLVDKNHDLVWYISGNDFYNIPAQTPLSSSAKYGYEWGGDRTETGINDRSIGKGLSNTNSLISMNLQLDTSDWNLLWDMVKQFRQNHSDKWFVPTPDELLKVCVYRTDLNNLSYGSGITDNYQTSCELNTTGSIYYYKSIEFRDKRENDRSRKNNHGERVRLCRYATASELPPKSSTETIQIKCATSDATIRYTLDGNNPTESSTLYRGQFEVTSPVTVKAKAWKSGMLASDVAMYEVEHEHPIPVGVPMALPDGSVLFYDRGSEYGEYHIGDDGYPIRNDGATDAGSADSMNWRYLICDNSDLDNGGTRQWGPYDVEEDVGNDEIGFGLPNTNAMIVKYANNNTYWWKFIKEKRDSTGFDWFIASKDELLILYHYKDYILSLGGVSLQSAWYWSSSDHGKKDSWCVYFLDGDNTFTDKNNTYCCRLIRRI